MRASWLKFALQGSTYARALQNRAERTHGAGNVDPSTFAATAAQPQARFDTDLSSYARQSGALAPTSQSRAMTDLASRMPWAGEEHTTDANSAKAPDRFNRLLDSRGLSQTTPGGHGALQQQITQSFGSPEEFRAKIRGVDRAPAGAPAEPQTGAGTPASIRARSATPAPSPSAQTSVLPAPAAPPAAPPRGPGYANTNVSNARAHAPTMPAPIPGAAGPAAAAPRAFPRAGFQMGKVGYFQTGLEGLFRAA